MLSKKASNNQIEMLPRHFRSTRADDDDEEMIPSGNTSRVASQSNGTKKINSIIERAAMDLDPDAHTVMGDTAVKFPLTSKYEENVPHYSRSRKGIGEIMNARRRQNSKQQHNEFDTLPQF